MSWGMNDWGDMTLGDIYKACLKAKCCESCKIWSLCNMLFSCKRACELERVLYREFPKQIEGQCEIQSPGDGAESESRSAGEDQSVHPAEEGRYFAGDPVDFWQDPPGRCMCMGDISPIGREDLECLGSLRRYFEEHKR